MTVRQNHEQTTDMSELPRTPQLICSEHAIQRFAQRVLGLNNAAGLDHEKIRREIIERIGKAFAKIGDASYPLGDGLRAIVKGGTVVTVCRKEPRE